MNYKPEPAIWSCDTGQQIPWFDRCQLTITWISNIKEGGYKSRLYISVNLLASLENGHHLAWLRHRRCCHRHCAYVPMSNTASHDNHEKIHSWVSFSFLYEYGAPLGGPSSCWSSAVISITHCLSVYSFHIHVHVQIYPNSPRFSRSLLVFWSPIQVTKSPRQYEWQSIRYWHFSDIFWLIFCLLQGGGGGFEYLKHFWQFN